MSLESQLTKLSKILEETNSKLDALLQRPEPGLAGVIPLSEQQEVKTESSSEKETTEATPSAPDAQTEKAGEASSEATASAPGAADASTGAELKEVMREKLIAVREQEGDNTKAIAVMKEFGAASIGKVKEDDYQNIINACEEILL